MRLSMAMPASTKARAQLLNAVLFASCKRSLSSVVGMLTMDKDLVTELRKKTGFPFKKCTEALRLHKNDIVQAESWLHKQAEKEGWEKAGKLSGRSAKQGLVGVLAENNLAVFVELNCETDFVARNQLFRELLSVCARATLNFRRDVVAQNTRIDSMVGGDTSHLREMVLAHDLHNLPAAGSGAKLQDLVVGLLGKVGENIQLKRALAVTTSKDNLLFCGSHGNGSGVHDGCYYGNYAAAVFIRPRSLACDRRKLDALGKGLVHHIIGMNPSSLDDKDNGLLGQEYMLNESKTVAQLAEQESVEVVDFVRYAVN